MNNRLKAWLPKPETLRSNRWLRWMGPVLSHPRLWHFSRKGISLGLALGIFFGLLIPVAQMPLAAASAVILRANLPMAVASTLVTNPVTFGPVYFGAYRLGKAVLREEPATDQAVEQGLMSKQVPKEAHAGTGRRIREAWNHLTTVGKPLVVGLAIVASISGLSVYFLVSGFWILKTRWTRHQRLRRRAAGK